MAITLYEIDRSNFWNAIRLQVKAGQKAFVWPNVQCIAWSKVCPHLTPYAIYHGQTMVGFTLFSNRPNPDDPDPDSYWIESVMIDRAYQGQGYGKEAVSKIVDRLKGRPDCKRIRLQYKRTPENLVAAHLYESLGFRETGRMFGVWRTAEFQVDS